jgi:HEAT repeat protein
MSRGRVEGAARTLIAIGHWRWFLLLGMCLGFSSLIGWACLAHPGYGDPSDLYAASSVAIESSPQDEATLEDLIQSLGDEQYSTRERAEHTLWKSAHPSQLQWLEQRLAREPDPEIRSRLAEIVRLLRFVEVGLPKDLVRLLDDNGLNRLAHAYKSDDAALRVETLRDLLPKGMLQGRGIFRLSPRVLRPLVKDFVAMRQPSDERHRASLYEIAALLRVVGCEESILSALRDPSSTVRAAAAKGIGRLRIHAALPKLVNLLEDPVPEVRSSALWSLQSIGKRELAAALSATALRGGEREDIRCLAIDTLLRITPENATRVLCAWMESGDSKLRADAVRTVVSEGLDELRDECARLCEDKDKTLRLLSITALFDLGSAKEISAEHKSELCRESIAILDHTSDDDEVQSYRQARIAAIEVIRRFGDMEMAWKLVPLLEDEDRLVRSYAAEAIGSLGVPNKCRGRLIDLAESGEHEARIVALRVIGLARVKEARSIVARAFSDSEETIRLEAVRALASVEGSDAVETICSLRWDRSALVRFAVIDALRDLSPSKAREQLRELLTSDDPRVRTRAAAVLGMFGEEEDVGRLATLLDDDFWTVRCEVAIALSRLGSRAGLGQLCEMLELEWDLPSVFLALLHLKEPQLARRLEGVSFDGAVDSPRLEARLVGSGVEQVSSAPFVGVRAQGPDLRSFLTELASRRGLFLFGHDGRLEFMEVDRALKVWRACEAGGAFR